MHCKYNDSEIFSFNTRTDLTVSLNILCTCTVTYFMKYLLCQFRFTQDSALFIPLFTYCVKFELVRTAPRWRRGVEE